MEIKIQKKDLLLILSKVVGVLNPKPTLPVLNHILFESNKNRFTITGTDLELSIKINKEIPNIIKEGKVLIPGKKLLEIIREFPEVEILLKSERENLIRISHDKINLSLVGLRVDDFPLIPKIKTPFQFKVNSTSLKKSIIYTRPIVVFNENKPNLSGVFLTTEDGWLTAVSTDTRRLARYKTKINLSTNIKVILPIRAADAARSLWEEDVELDVTLGSNQIILSSEDLALTSQIIEGEFPDYTTVIPKNEDMAAAAIPMAEFTSAVRRIKQVVSAGKNMVKLDFRKTLLRISGETAGVGEGLEEIGVAFEGDSAVTYFNPDYLIEGLKGVEDENEFIFGINRNPERPSMIRPAKSTDYLCLIMPMSP